MKNGILQIVKATLAALLFSMAFVLVFTLIVQLASLSANVVKPVTQVFKTLAIAAGGLIFIRGEKGFLKGCVYGLLSVILTYLLFSIISGSFAVSWLFVFEVLLGIVAGAISGIIAVNVKKS